MVRQVLQQMRAAVPAEVSDKLELSKEDRLGRLKVRHILRGLKKSGGATQNAMGQYSLVDDPARRGGVQAKLWEFMCLRYSMAQPWTVKESAKRAACTWDYAKRYVKFLCDQGLIEPVGQKANAVLYRVVPGKEREPAPHWNRREEKRQAVQQIPPGPPLAKGGEAPADGTPAPPEEGKTIYQMGLEAAASRCDLTGGQCASFPEGCELCPVWTVFCLEVAIPTQNCDLRGQGGCKGFPQECERCNLQAAGDIDPDEARVINARTSTLPMPILNCDCPGADCAACAAQEAPPADQVMAFWGLMDKFLSGAHGIQAADPVMAFWDAMDNFMAGVQDVLAISSAHMEQAQEILLQMEREMGKLSRRVAQKEGGGHDSESRRERGTE